MILKALYDYYNRCEGLSAKGLEQKEIGYLIVIDKDGTFVRIESRMKDKKTAQTFLVLQTIKRSGRKYAPNILWDNYEYVIGGADESAKKHDTFIRMIEKIKEQVPSGGYGIFVLLPSCNTFFINYFCRLSLSVFCLTGQKWDKT